VFLAKVVKIPTERIAKGQEMVRKKRFPYEEGKLVESVSVIVNCWKG